MFPPFYKITIGIGEKSLNLKIRIFNFFFSLFYQILRFDIFLIFLLIMKCHIFQIFNKQYAKIMHKITPQL